MLITRCPHCETTFRVRMEQLNLRGGRVRCGHCHVPFSALDSLEELPEETATSSLPSAPPQPFVAPPAPQAATWTTPPAELAPELVTTDGHMADSDADPISAIDLPPTPLALHRSDSYHADTSQAEITQLVAPATEQDEDLAFQIDEPGADETQRTAPGDTDAPVTDPDQEFIELGSAADDADNEADQFDHASDQDDAQEGGTVIPASVLHDGEDDGDEVPQLHTVFLDEEDIQPGSVSDPAIVAAQAKKRRTLLLGNGLLLLTGLLLSTYVLRVELTRLYPGLRAPLEQACQYISCDVPYPRDADEVLLVGSDLTQASEPKGAYHLAVTVRNHAQYPVAWPQLEVTLTDRFERALTRRVLEPQDWLPASLAQRPAFEAQGELTAQITLSSDAQVMGYRLGVFYR